MFFDNLAWFILRLFFFFLVFFSRLFVSSGWSVHYQYNCKVCWKWSVESCIRTNYTCMWPTNFPVIIQPIQKGLVSQLLIYFPILQRSSFDIYTLIHAKPDTKQNNQHTLLFKSLESLVILIIAVILFNNNLYSVDWNTISYTSEGIARCLF